MRFYDLKIFGLLIIYLFVFVHSFHCVKRNYDEMTNNDLKENKIEESVEDLNNQDELAEAGLLKYAGVFGGPSDYADIDDSLRSRRVKRYKS